MKLTIALASAFALIPMLSTQVDARPGGHDGFDKHGPKMFSPKMLEHAASKLGLDDATLTSIKERAHRGRKEGIPLKGVMEAARLDLKHALDSQSPDRSEVMRLAEAVGRAHIKMKQHHLNVMLDIREMLTPDQVKQLKTMRHELKAKRKRFRKQRRERRERRKGGGERNRGDR